MKQEKKKKKKHISTEKWTVEHFHFRQIISVINFHPQKNNYENTVKMCFSLFTLKEN